MVLNVYKPQGVTPYGWRKQHEQRTASVDYGSLMADGRVMAAGEVRSTGRRRPA